MEKIKEVEMKEIENEQLKDIKGGGIGLILIGFSVLLVLVAGILDGITRPVKCDE